MGYFFCKYLCLLPCCKYVYLINVVHVATFDDGDAWIQ